MRIFVGRFRDPLSSITDIFRVERYWGIAQPILALRSGRFIASLLQGQFELAPLLGAPLVARINHR
ncbi:MAG: hypothetical protein WBW73_26165 [Rhodoplanes sp.]